MTGIIGVIVWLIIAIAFIILEGVTVQLVSVWFVIGTIPAMIIAGFGGDLIWQIVAFLVVSVLVLIILRPIAKKRLTPKIEATNADRVIGMTGIVQESINNFEETGRVTANGLVWTARTKDDNTKVEKGERIKVIRIDGVKLIVEPETKHG